MAGLLNKFRAIAVLALLVCMMILFIGSPVSQAKAQATDALPIKQVAVVIDDFGNGMDGTEEILDLAVPLTVAVMPFLPTTKADAWLAHKKGHEVIVHLPMQPIRGKKSWLGPGAITTDLADDEVRNRVKAAIDDVPFAIGISNHMGSKATSDERIVRILVEVCKEKGMMILDSRTTDKSLIGKFAKQMAVPYAENQLFLDDIYTVSHISKQMAKLEKLLHSQDQCIAIGHVGPSGKKTAQVLESSIPSMQKIARFVPVSKLMRIEP
jgi:polysaccharide deacetylase 2 family uncharacterized protein YibQ